MAKNRQFLKKESWQNKNTCYNKNIKSAADKRFASSISYKKATFTFGVVGGCFFDFWIYLSDQLLSQ